MVGVASQRRGSCGLDTAGGLRSDDVILVGTQYIGSGSRRPMRLHTGGGVLMDWATGHRRGRNPWIGGRVHYIGSPTKFRRGGHLCMEHGRLVGLAPCHGHTDNLYNLFVGVVTLLRHCSGSLGTLLPYLEDGRSRQSRGRGHLTMGERGGATIVQGRDYGGGGRGGRGH